MTQSINPQWQNYLQKVSGQKFAIGWSLQTKCVGEGALNSLNKTLFGGLPLAYLESVSVPNKLPISYGIIKCGFKRPQ